MDHSSRLNQQLLNPDEDQVDLSRYLEQEQESEKRDEHLLGSDSSRYDDLLTNEPVLVLDSLK